MLNLNLSEKQKNFFENLKKAYGKEPLPSFEKIAQAFGFKHKNSVWQYFNKLKECDLIIEKNGKFIFPSEASLKKPRTGARMTARQHSFAIPLINFTVFPSGRTAESIAVRSTMPMILSRYALKISPPTNR